MMMENHQESFFDGKPEDTHESTENKKIIGNMNRISYENRSRLWLAAQPLEERNRIIRKLQKFCALRDAYARVYDFCHESGMSYAEVIALPEVQDFLNGVYAEWEHVSLCS